MMKHIFPMLAAAGFVMMLNQPANAQSAPIVVLEYPSFTGESGGGVNANHPFVRDANHTASHTVQSGETLSHVITNYYGDSGLDLSVVKMAIVKVNAHAFVRGNANFLYAEKKLHLPSLNEIKNLVMGKRAKGSSSDGNSRGDQIYFIGG